MLHTTKGIVFHTSAYADTSVIAKVYTEKFGLQSYLVNSVRSSKAKNKSGFFQPLTILDLVVYHKPDKGLQRISDISFAHHLHSIPFDTLKSAQAIFITEVLYRSIREEESNQNLFLFLENSILKFDAAQDEFVNFHIYFLLQLTTYLGFRPIDNFYAQHPYFDLQDGVFISMAPIHRNYLDGDATALFAMCMQSAFNNQSFALNYRQRDEMLQSLLIYYSLHLPAGFKVQSYDVLRELLH